ncbi:hypothetical protein MKJ04_21230 [Pontibacter sp. E15-1]|uniref:hypothetical protein n=1 Tax=Pontibacter sp. E15-1 TaxID=2919918 RepID=UPI001F4FE4E0|nr:hypothetical protein [Pontibacter sp. E15-1]MCJ8167378.1 hypothetical protein [Pontibacter sp. E15-1]
MKKNILLFLALLPLCLLFQKEALAQNDRSAYTGNNTIRIDLEGIGQRYQFVSNQMLVRHNKETHRLECVVPVASLIPTNDSIPPDMAYEVLYGAKYPELLILIAEPEQQSSQGRFNPSTINRKTSINLQGVNNDTRIPVAYLKENTTIYFSTNFDLMLGNFQASMPVKYLPILTGRVLFSIEKAYWYNMTSN